jgi:antitoxin YefM
VWWPFALPARTEPTHPALDQPLSTTQGPEARSRDVASFDETGVAGQLELDSPQPMIYAVSPHSTQGVCIRRAPQMAGLVHRSVVSDVDPAHDVSLFRGTRRRRVQPETHLPHSPSLRRHEKQRAVAGWWAGRVLCAIASRMSVRNCYRDGSSFARNIGYTVHMTAVPLGDARDRLSEYVSEVERTHQRVTITRHGHPAAVLISADDLAAIEETLEILGTPGAAEAVGEGLADAAAGRFADNDELKSRYGNA